MTLQELLARVKDLDELARAKKALFKSHCEDNTTSKRDEMEFKEIKFMEMRDDRTIHERRCRHGRGEEGRMITEAELEECKRRLKDCMVIASGPRTIEIIDLCLWSIKHAIPALKHYSSGGMRIIEVNDIKHFIKEYGCGCCATSYDIEEDGECGIMNADLDSDSVKGYTAKAAIAALPKYKE